ncbi:MAG: hypothetical protein WAV73_06050 [Candidatus Moraniibacteriota bacterium]
MSNRANREGGEIMSAGVLITYAKEAELFSKEGLKVFLDDCLGRQVEMIAVALKALHNQRKPILMPVPDEVVNYIGNNKMGIKFYLAVLPTG